MSKHILILGAGLAGLSAALELHEAGFKTTVLEARHRVGGRVFTLRDGFTDGQYAEGGGEFIDSHHQRMLALAHRFGLELEEHAGMDGWADWVTLEGHTGRVTDAALWGANLETELNRLWTAVAELGRAVPDPAAPQLAPNAHTLDQQSVADWLKEQAVHPLAVKIFVARLRSEYLAEPEQFSLLELARWGAFYYADGSDERATFRVVGGNDQLPKAMARLLPDVRLGAQVVEVHQAEERVRVQYQTGNGSHRVDADFAVLALPPGPIQYIRFTPEPSIQHWAMWRDIACGPVTKVIVQYGSRFWEEHGWHGNLSTDLPITCVWNATRQSAQGGGLLTVYTGSKHGEAFTALNDATRIAEALAQMEQAVPGGGRWVRAVRTIAWANEPFTQGGYVFFPPGTVTEYWERLRAPLGRVHVAGEHTAVHQGYMEGAVESGQRAAREIMARV